MKKKLLTFIPYAITLAFIFYVLPLLIRNTGLAMLVMLVVIPLFTFICAIVYGVRQGFDFLLTLIAAILFSPTIFIYYNSSAWIYIIVYAVITLAGNGIGRIFYKKR